ncbi:hypothetical protein FHU36_001015 [Nonomuraea muscovyensis]|uniref:Uncharacterized protein n=1 Tax=Nonomuraea muscovyensis TaxID=1124761 RepID=A0A7X0BYI9_9ACTN|nr:hypothetical protein [Nonomuraea muscovyensis]MBB6344506.1 hypothetical protein [Nonomuraea muscovyensis]
MPKYRRTISIEGLAEDLQVAIATGEYTTSAAVELLMSFGPELPL